MASFTVTNYQNKKYDGTHCWRVSFLQINTIWRFKNQCQHYVSISIILISRRVDYLCILVTVNQLTDLSN